MADSTSSRLAMLFDAGTRTRTSRSGWRNGMIGRGVTGRAIMGIDRMTVRGALPAVLVALLAAACSGEAPSAGGGPSPSGSPSASPSRSVPLPAAPPVIAFDPPKDTSQASRYVAGRWTSTVPLLDVQFAVAPE